MNFKNGIALIEDMGDAFTLERDLKQAMPTTIERPTMAFPIQIDATQLSSPSFLIPGKTGWLEAQSIQTLQLDPGTYSFQTRAGLDTSWGFKVTAQGTIEYATARDVGQGGILRGRGTTKLAVVGYDVSIDVTALSLERFYLNGVTGWLDAHQPQTLHLLPMAGYQLVQGNGVLAETAFQVLLGDSTVGGRMDYDTTRDVGAGRLFERARHAEAGGYRLLRTRRCERVSGYGAASDAGRPRHRHHGTSPTIRLPASPSRPDPGTSHHAAEECCIRHGAERPDHLVRAIPVRGDPTAGHAAVNSLDERNAEAKAAVSSGD